MGAFDGLVFPRYGLVGDTPQETAPTAQRATLLYVSWVSASSIYHNYTGQHFKDRESADACYKARLIEGLKPIKFYE